MAVDRMRVTRFEQESGKRGVLGIVQFGFIRTPS